MVGYRWASTCIGREGGSPFLRRLKPMMEAESSRSESPISHTCVPDNGPNRSEFEDLLRRASEVLRAPGKVERGGLGIENPRV